MAESWRPALLALVMAAAGAQASHGTSYAQNPVEHDDLGRALEPDVGEWPAIAQCMLDTDGDGRCTDADLAAWPPGRLVAAGCTLGGQRAPSGTCALGGNAGPCIAPAPVRFLDLHEVVHFNAPQQPHTRVEVNAKLVDATTLYGRAELGLLPRAAFAGPAQTFAWLGVFTDRNCNGVIDHLGGAQADPRNEFSWLGRCVDFAGNNVVPLDVCRPEAGAVVVWEFPGEHHDDGNALACDRGCPLITGPRDMPGALVLCMALRVTALPLEHGCSADEAGWGDPLLGDQVGARPDYYLQDYTGDPQLAVRGWHGYYSAWHYDASLLVTSTFVAAVDPPAVPGGEEEYELSGAAFVDVDTVQSLHPATSVLLQTAVKPALRANWLLARGLLPLD